MNGFDEIQAVLSFEALEIVVNRHLRDLIEMDGGRSSHRLQVRLDGEDVHPGRFTRWTPGYFGIEFRRVDPDLFDELLRGGATLRIRRVDELVDLTRLGPEPRRRREAEDAPLAIDLVARWRRATTEEVSVGPTTTVVQVHGWQTIVADDGPGATLGPGQTLEMAAGTRGRATGPLTDVASVHLEVTSARPTVADYLGWLRSSVVRSEVSRAALPVPEGGGARRAHMEALTASLEALVDEQSVEGFTRHWRREHMLPRTPALPWAALGGVLELPEGTMIRFVGTPGLAGRMEARLRERFPHISAGDVAAITAAMDEPVPVEAVLGAATDRDAVRKALTALVRSGVVHPSTGAGPAPSAPRPGAHPAV